MDNYAPELCDVSDHLVGMPHRLSVAQLTVSGHVKRCKLCLSSRDAVKTAEYSLPITYENCPDAGLYQVFEFLDDVAPCEAIALLLMHHYQPTVPPELFAWQSFYLKNYADVSTEVGSPYPLLAVGQLSRRMPDGFQYVPRIDERGHKIYAFSMVPFIPRRPVPCQLAYYVLGRCPEDGTVH